MILVKTPLRLSFFGGGSDLAAYYNQQPGFCLSTTIDQYMYTAVCETSYPGIRLVYSEIEQVEKLSELKHDRVREALKMMKVKSNIEISSYAQIPTKGTGLGSSSTYTVGLLNALATLKDVPMTKYDLAEAACDIEINKCNEPIGKQDQYAAAFGGFNSYTFTPEHVDVSPVVISGSVLHQLNNNLLLFYTGVKRNASDILSEQSNNMKSQSDMVDRVQGMITLGQLALKSLYQGDVDDFGSLLGQAWNLKKSLSSNITNSSIDEWYWEALTYGALGGKIAGAGGGGFLLLYVPYAKQTNVIQAMERCGLTHFKFRFSESGSEIVYNN